MDSNSFMGSTINGVRNHINNFATHSGATLDSMLFSASQSMYNMEDKAAAATAKANSMISSAKQNVNDARNYVGSTVTNTKGKINSTISSAKQNVNDGRNYVNSKIASAKQAMTPERIRTAKRFGGVLLGGAALMSIYNMLDDDY